MTVKIFQQDKQFLSCDSKSSESTRDNNTSPLNWAALTGELYLSEKEREVRRNSGQYFTSVPLAKSVADLIKTPKHRNIKIMDAGAGSGILSCAVVEKIVSDDLVDSIELHLFELDKNISSTLENNLNNLKVWCTGRGVNLTFEIFFEDFIRYYANNRSLFSIKGEMEYYDLIVSNPPYYKIRNDKRILNVFKDLNNGQPNAYALFMIACVEMLNQDGQAIFVTPRSFTNGPTFSKYRNRVLSLCYLSDLQAFRTRKNAFLGESVLQEIVLSSFIRSKALPIDVKVGYSDHVESDVQPDTKFFQYREIVSSDNTIRLTPVDNIHRKMYDAVKSNTNTLKGLGLRVSTGKVVPHEDRKYLRSTKEDALPLIWMSHVNGDSISWPIANFKNFQYISKNFPENQLLLHGVPVIIIRRCAFKGANKRVYCSYFEGFDEYSYYAVENHLNYIYFEDNNTISKELIRGVEIYLNSESVDIYLSAVCGSTQINAKDLESLPFPDRDTLIELGAHVDHTKRENND